jgi:hypothetical protein
MRYIVASPVGSNTEDIVQALARAVPGAVNQAKEIFKNYKKTDPLNDALVIAKYIQKKTPYKKDGFEEQRIVLPSRFLKYPGDCKSFALFNLAAMIALGYDAGVRFASYRKNKIPTHVYNWIKVNGKKYAYDSTLSDLEESNKFTYLRDMKVTYLAESPTMIEDNSFVGSYIGRRKRPKKQKSGKGKKILAAPIRGAFLSLVRLNARGLATKLKSSFSKNRSEAEAFWKKLGGNFKKLEEAVNKGATKKALFGKGKGVNGANQVVYMQGIGAVDLAALAALLASAAPALIAVSKLFKKQGIPEGEGDIITSEEASRAEPLNDGEGFEVVDKEIPGTASGTASGGGFSFAPSPLILIGGAAVLYFVLSKKKK